jgi:hypothetical protein
LRHRLSGQAIPDEPSWKFCERRVAGRFTERKCAVLPDLRPPFSVRGATQGCRRGGRVGAETALAREVLKNLLADETSLSRSAASQEVF